MKLSLVIPAYNEEKTILDLLQKVVDMKLPKDIKKEIIVVDDGSKDKTYDLVKKFANKNKEVTLYKNEVNLGKSQTVKKGLLLSTGEYVVIQDADLEYDPNELPLMLQFMLENKLDVVYGDRFGKKNRVIYWGNYIGNKFLSFVSNLFTYPRLAVWIPDMEVCYKMFRGEIIRDIAKQIISKSMFGLEPEITAKMSKYLINGKRIFIGIYPISYYPRSIAEGKHMKAFKDGFLALLEILRFNLGK